jgi:methylenetetrahydrofolate reductase (NADPH)
MRSLCTAACRGAGSHRERADGVSITRLLTTARPDALIEEPARGLDPARHGEVLLHFYPFGGLKTTAQWVLDFRRAQGF